MTDYNKGWWSCFLSFCNELITSGNSDDREVFAVLRGAGITNDEVDEFVIINHDIISDEIMLILGRYVYENRMGKQ